MDDWGFNGPTLANVDSFEQMYGETYTVGFSTIKAKEEARRRTGWATWDDKVLEAPNVNGLIKTNEPGKPTRYYADFFLREVARLEELLADVEEVVQWLRSLRDISRHAR